MPAGLGFRQGQVTERLIAIRNLAREAAGRIQAAVSIASTHAIASSFFPAWLYRVEREVGRFPLRFDCHRADRCFDALHEGTVEFVICNVPSRAIEWHGSQKFDSIHLAPDEAFPVSAPDAAGRAAHRLPGTKSKPTAYLSLAPGSWIGSAVRVLLAEREPSAVLETVFETPLAEAIKTMALRGQGLAWLPRSMIGGELIEGRLVAAGDDDWTIPMQVRIFRSARLLTPRADALWAHLTATRLQEP